MHFNALMLVFPATLGIHNWEEYRRYESFAAAYRRWELPGLVFETRETTYPRGHGTGEHFTLIRMLNCVHLFPAGKRCT
jgi:hypothetical protein